MKRITTVLVALGVLAAGCGGVSEEELAAVAEPLVQAHDDLEDFQFQMGAGMSRGDFLDDWPATAAAISRQLNDFVDSEPELDEPDAEDLSAYAVGIANATDQLTRAAQVTRDFIFNDGAESDMDTAMSQATAAYEVLDSLKDAALTPGEG